MAKDPVCGMFVEEKSDSIRYAVDGREYYFCATQCLNEFTQPEKQLKKLKRHVIAGIALTIPIVIFTYFAVLPEHLNNYIMFALATPVQFFLGSEFFQFIKISVEELTAIYKS